MTHLELAGDLSTGSFIRLFVCSSPEEDNQR